MNVFYNQKYNLVINKMRWRYHYYVSNGGVLRLLVTRNSANPELMTVRAQAQA